MATVASTNIQRIWVQGSGSRVALFRISNASSGDTADLTTTFQFVQGGMAVQASAFGTIASSVTRSSGGNGVEFSALTGLSTTLIWVTVMGVSA